MDITMKDMVTRKVIPCIECGSLTTSLFGEKTCSHCMVEKSKKLQHKHHAETTHFEVCNELNETYKRKNNDYGDSFKKSYDEFGIVSAIVRMSDKMERLKSLTGSGDILVKDESIEDTILDMANYAIMTVMEMRNRR